MAFGGLSPSEQTHLSSSGFKSIYKAKTGGVRFADLLDKVSEIDPEVRIRFTAPHPKDFPEEVRNIVRKAKTFKGKWLFKGPDPDTGPPQRVQPAPPAGAVRQHQDP